MQPNIALVALPVPLDREFDYQIPVHLSPVIGGRVSVLFGRQKLVGIVTELKNHSDVPVDKIKPIIEVIDEASLWPEPLYNLLLWCSRFYQYPLGDTFSNALPGALRKGKAAKLRASIEWRLTAQGRDQLAIGFGRAVKQAKVMHILEPGPLTQHEITAQDINTSVLNTLAQKDWIESIETQPHPVNWGGSVEVVTDKPQLNTEQAIAIATVNSNHGYHCHLLEGVTGSGKTEVYLNLIKPVLEQGKQALVLVPEIGLTPQTINRFRNRFNVPIMVIHSGLNDTERVTAWLSAFESRVGIVIGTRSALFTPFDNLGIIIVDEEHDASYKQQDSLRYHARDVAIMRANIESIPIVLGSATPALETLNNALTGKYHHLTLSKRAGNALPTTNKILDVRGLFLESGLSAPLIAEMRKHLESGNQVLLFLNRRGFSPALMCHECGWIAECKRCDAYYTYHHYSREVRCHHCGSQQPVIHQCQSCQSSHLLTVGVGTEQLECQLSELFPNYKSIRIDRDSTRKKGSLEGALDAIQNGEYQILIGTQMLAKGHHFPNVTLVALLDVDSSLYSSDFRASERLAQLFIQVSGRAGRASKPGEVVLQTHHPENRLLKTLLVDGYHHFAQEALLERKSAFLPPFTFLTLVRAEANRSDWVEEFLRQVRHALDNHHSFKFGCQILGPTPAPLAKKAGKYRWHLLVQAQKRSIMHQLLRDTKEAITSLPMAKRVRWCLDIDPHDMS